MPPSPGRKPPPTTTPVPAPPRDAPPAPSALLRVPVVAGRLDVSLRHVRRLIAAGDQPAHRIGRAVRVAEADLGRFLRRARQ
jgi:excisionase family DNA binding protein